MFKHFTTKRQKEKMIEQTKKPNFSYSRLEQFENCPLAYDFKYNKKMFFGGDTIITQLGTLIHSCEEQISLALKEGKTPDYNKIKDYLYNVNIPKKNQFDTEGGIYGINILKTKYPTEYYKPSDKTGLSYFNKVENYVQHMHRQEEYMEQHPELEIWDVEHPFIFVYRGYTMKGFIDRIFKYKGEDRFVIHDIKTRDRLFEENKVPTPLQHIIYAISLKNELGLATEPDEFAWDLVLIQQYQQCGTKGCIKRGYKKLDKLFDGIEAGDFAPKPSPLCYWCSFSNTNPDVTEEGKNVCPYYQKWTPDKKDFSTMFQWAGPEMIEEHRTLLAASNKPSVKYSGFIL